MNATLAHSPPPPDIARVDEIVARLGRTPDAAIPILQALQEEFGYLPQEALMRVCESTEIRPAALAGVASFYSQFRHRPSGKHVVKVCHGTACHVKGTTRVRDELRRHFQLAEGEDTDASGQFTIDQVQCLGCCTLAPVVQIDQTLYGHVSPQKVPALLEDFRTRATNGTATGRAANPVLTGQVRGEVRICTDSCCVARGCGKVRQAVEAAILDARLPVHVKRVGCVVQCEQTPLLEIAVPGHPIAVYTKVQPHDVPAILRHHFKPSGLRHRLRSLASGVLDRLVSDESTGVVERYGQHHRDPFVGNFLRRQQHIAMDQFGSLDPTNLEQFRAHGGFLAAQKCLTELAPADVVRMVTDSGLRGRGGAGFPTGSKWGMVRDAIGQRKFIIANGDEGDPGAFMDRMLMESFPYRVLEGMIIAAYAIGSHEGFLYVRAEYPFAVKRLDEAIRCCEAQGILGESVFGTDFSLKLTIKQGAGAFVCGEETALIASLEGRRGMPRLRPPFPAQRGLWDQPTLINNVETLAVVPWIISRGPAAFHQLGSAKSKGTKVFALAGKVRQGGLVEVPMGITIRQVVEEIGGGIPGGKRFKAVLVGGPSGGCVPAELADIPIDYEALTKVGAIMGSGGLVVLDEEDCMVDIARYFLRFTQIESCGKCTFCRIGTRRMLDIFDRLCAGQAKRKDLEELERLAGLVSRASICGLGRTAPNPTLSTLRYFRHEYEAHLEGHCPAGRCDDLIAYEVTDACTGCTLCAQQCPVEAIPMTPYRKHRIAEEKCTRCDACRQVCPAQAIAIVPLCRK